MPDESYLSVISGHDRNKFPISVYFQGHYLDDATVSFSSLEFDFFWNQ